MQEYTYTIEGDFSSIRALEIKEELIGLAKTCTDLTVDATAVQKSDIGSINALMMCHKAIGINGGKMTLRVLQSGSSELIELLHVTKFGQILDIQYS